MRPLQTYADPNATATIEIEQDDGVPVAILQIADNSLRAIVDTSREHHGRREQPCHKYEHRHDTAGTRNGAYCQYKRAFAQILIAALGQLNDLNAPDWNNETDGFKRTLKRCFIDANANSHWHLETTHRIIPFGTI